MKIINLQVENVMRVSAINITPTDNVVVIGGKNGQGKSSILNSIAYALGGASALPEKPLKEGTKAGFITIDMGEISVTRKFVRKADETVSTSLEVKNADGFTTKSPQSLLDSLKMKTTFDPLEFSRLKPKDQLDRLKELVNLDFSDLDAQRKDAYEERTIYNREMKQVESLLSQFPDFADLPDSEVSISDLMNELSEKQKINRNNEQLRKSFDLLEAECKEKNTKIVELNQQIIELQNLVCLLEEEQMQLRNRHLDALLAVRGLTDENESIITEKIKNAESNNALIRKKSEKIALTAKFSQLSQKSSEFSQQILDIDIKKKEMMVNAPFPVPGLGFDENGIILNGLPFQQASSAEQLRVSVAMGIAINPKLNVMLIKDGSLLDEDSMKIIADMANKSGAQIWLEKVGEGQDCSVIISDGHIKE